MIERGEAHPRRFVRDARNGSDAHTECARDNYFWNRTHADSIDAEFFKHPHFGGRFIGRTEQSAVDAVLQRDAHGTRRIVQLRTEGTIVRLRHIWKALVARLDRTGKWIAIHEIQMVSNDHQIARRKGAPHTAGCI